MRTQGGSARRSCGKITSIYILDICDSTCLGGFAAPVSGAAGAAGAYDRRLFPGGCGKTSLGIRIDEAQLSDMLALPVLSLSARRKKDAQTLWRAIRCQYRRKRDPQAAV